MESLQITERRADVWRDVRPWGKRMPQGQGRQGASCRSRVGGSGEGGRTRHRLTHGATCPGCCEPTLGHDICDPPQGDLENSVCVGRWMPARGQGCTVHCSCACDFSARAELLPDKVKDQKTKNNELQLAWIDGQRGHKGLGPCDQIHLREKAFPLHCICGRKWGPPLGTWASVGGCHVQSKHKSPLKGKRPQSRHVQVGEQLVPDTAASGAPPL